MGLLALADVGMYRDHTPSPQPITVRASMATSSPAGPPATNGSPQPTYDVVTGSVASYGKLLTAQIPGEALLAYTTLLALFPDGNTNYTPGRWIIYGASMVVCAAVVIGAYLAQRNRDDFTDPTTVRRVPKLFRHLPYFPAATAVFAMAVYGLTVPGSALQQSMNPTSYAVVAGCLAVGGGVVMAVLAPFLGKGNTATLKSSAPATRPPPGHTTITPTLHQPDPALLGEPVPFPVTRRTVSGETGGR